MAILPVTQATTQSAPVTPVLQSTPAMPAVTPYQPRLGVATAPVQPTVFGVPMTQPGQAGSSRQSRRRGAANQEATAARIRRLNIKTLMVLFPRDVRLIISKVVLNL
jgi:hypothetical protein